MEDISYWRHLLARELGPLGHKLSANIPTLGRIFLEVRRLCWHVTCNMHFRLHCIIHGSPAAFASRLVLHLHTSPSTIPS
jgi:hypothetical protein